MMNNRQNNDLSDLTKELSLCEKRLEERIEEVSKVNNNTLEHDILLMEIELLEMLINALQKKINQKVNINLSTKTRKAVFSIKPTIN